MSLCQSFHRPGRSLGRVEVYLYSILDLCIRSGWGVSITPRQHITPGKDPVPIVQEAGWASGPVWTGAENLAPPGFDPLTVRHIGTVQVKFLSKNGKANEWIISYFRDRYQSVEVNIEMSITMHFYTGEVQTRCSTRINSKFVIFFINISNCSKTIELLLANNTD